MQLEGLLYAQFKLMETPLRAAGVRFFIWDQAIDEAKEKDATKGVGQFPRVKVNVDTPNLIGPDTPKTFAMNDTAYGASVCDATIPGTMIARIVTIHSTIRGADQRAIEGAMDKFLLGKFPKMGLSWVTTFTVDKSTRDEKNKDTGGALKTVSRRTVRFQIRPWLSQLVS